MGFPCLFCCIILPRPLILFVQLLDLLELAVSYICPWQQVELAAYNYSPAPLSFPTRSSVIKRSLPVVKFSAARQSSALTTLEGDEDQAVCAICLGRLEEGDEVRELGSCSHVFHQLCIDKWMDASHVTCPLCRSQLLPRGKMEGE